MKKETEEIITDFLAHLVIYHIPELTRLYEWIRKHDKELWQKIREKSVYKFFENEEIELRPPQTRRKK